MTLHWVYVITWKPYQVGHQIWGYVWRRGGGVEWGSRGAEATTTKQCWLCHCQKRHLMNVSSFCLEAGRSDVWGRRVSETWVTLLGDNPGRAAPLCSAAGLEGEATRTFTHKCRASCIKWMWSLMYSFSWCIINEPRSLHHSPSPDRKGSIIYFPLQCFSKLRSGGNLKIRLKVTVRHQWSG